MNIQGYAQVARASFELRKRDNGEEFWCVRDGSPEWVTELVHVAHGDFGPDDTRYRMIREVLGEIDTDGDPDEVVYEADVATADLTRWLASHVYRVAIVDEACEEFGLSDTATLFERLQCGQIQEYQEIHTLVVQFLQALEKTESPS